MAFFFFCGLVRDWERCCNVVGRPGDGLQINENGGKHSIREHNF